MDKNNIKDKLEHTGLPTSFFKRVNRDIIFVYDSTNELLFTRSSDSIMLDTRTKIVSGLNHFLYYVEHYLPEDNIEKVNSFIVGSYTKMLSNHGKLDPTKYSYKDDVSALISKYCSIDNDEMMDIICSYVDFVTIENIDETKATTNVHLTNDLVKGLHIVATCVKFSFLFSALLRNDITFKTELLTFVDEIYHNSFNGYYRYKVKNDVDGEILTTDNFSSSIDEFLMSLVNKHWEDTARTKTYVDKFKNIGLDALIASKKNKMDLCESFKKYLPVIKSKETANRYSKTVSSREMYWTATKSFDDFKFVTLNTIDWVQKTLRSVVKQQDLKMTFTQDINVADILVNSNEESSMRRENSLYEDKEGHLLEIRQSSALSLFKKTVTELNKYEFNMRTEVKLFNDSSKHAFNQFVLSKIYLSITGEHKVYKNVMGRFNKVFLALFYIKIRDCKKVAKDILPIIDLMKGDSSLTKDMYSVTEIEEFLKEKEEEDGVYVDNMLFGKIVGVYGGEGVSRLLNMETFYKLFKYLKSPSRVRNLLFPEVYTDTSDTINTDMLENYTSADMEKANSVRERLLGGLTY